VQTDLGGDWGEWGAEGCPAELQHWHLTWTSPHQPCLSCLQASLFSPSNHNKGKERKEETMVREKLEVIPCWVQAFLGFSLSNQRKGKKRKCYAARLSI